MDCVHGLPADWCGEYHPTGTVGHGTRAALYGDESSSYDKGAALGRIDSQFTSLMAPVLPVSIVPVPSTDDFEGYERPAGIATFVALAGDDMVPSTIIHRSLMVPRLRRPHWEVTNEPVWQNKPMVKHYETSEYGETRFVGMVPARF